MEWQFSASKSLWEGKDTFFPLSEFYFQHNRAKIVERPSDLPPNWSSLRRPVCFLSLTCLYLNTVSGNMKVQWLSSSYLTHLQRIVFCQDNFWSVDNGGELQGFWSCPIQSFIHKILSTLHSGHFYGAIWHPANATQPLQVSLIHTLPRCQTTMLDMLPSVSWEPKGLRRGAEKHGGSWYYTRKSYVLTGSRVFNTDDKSNLWKLGYFYYELHA